jgi:hypothetical protein
VEFSALKMKNVNCADWLRQIRLSACNYLRTVGWVLIEIGTGDLNYISTVHKLKKSGKLKAAAFNSYIFTTRLFKIV